MTVAIAMTMAIVIVVLTIATTVLVSPNIIFNDIIVIIILIIIIIAFDHYHHFCSARRYQPWIQRIRTPRHGRIYASISSQLCWPPHEVQKTATSADGYTMIKLVVVDNVVMCGCFSEALA